MPVSTVTDVAPFRRLAFLTLGLSAAIIVAIALFRIGMWPWQWPTGLSAWLMLCAALLGPFPLLRRFAPPSWNGDLCVGPSVIAGLFLVWLLGFLNIVGWVLIAALALWGLASAIRAELPNLRASRLVGGIVLI